MDYSQFLMMPQEIGLLATFLLVFLYDTFMPSKCQKHLPVFTAVVFALYTALASFLAPPALHLPVCLSKAKPLGR